MRIILAALAAAVISSSAPAAVYVKTISFNDVLALPGKGSFGGYIDAVGFKLFDPPRFETKRGTLNAVTVSYDFSQLVTLKAVRTAEQATSDQPILLTINNYLQSFGADRNIGGYAEAFALTLPHYATSSTFSVPVAGSISETFTGSVADKVLSSQFLIASRMKAPSGDGFTSSVTSRGVGKVSFTYDYSLPSAAAPRSASAARAFSALAAVPEPSEWAMLIGGFAMVGAATRRRRRAKLSATYA